MNDADHEVAAERVVDNGLRADDYVRVARPTATLAAAALDALRRTGIAARVSATAGDGQRVELWADARELDDVATVLAAVARHAGADAPELGRVGEEASLAELGEREVDPTDTDDDRDDDEHDDDDARHGTRNPTPSARPYPTPSRPTARRRPRAAAPDDDDDPDDHFQPGEPESLRTLSRTTVWALAVLALGVLALALSGLAPTLVGPYAPLASLLGTAAVLVGVGMLVTRLRDGHRGDDDDRGGPNGDGAVL